MKWLFTIATSFVGLLAMAQADNEIQVYASPTVGRNRTIFELHSIHTGRGSKFLSDPKSVSWTTETLEITHGFGDRFEIGLYTFSGFDPDGSFHYQGNQIRPRYTFTGDEAPLGLSLSTEFGFFRPHRDSNFIWQGEIRPIIDLTAGNWYFSLNPNMDFVVSGPEKEIGFGPQFKTVYTIKNIVGIGAEYYSSYGPFKNFLPGQQQEHILGPAIDLYFHPDWEFNTAYFFGLTDGSNQRIFKLLLGKRIGK